MGSGVRIGRRAGKKKMAEMDPDEGEKRERERQLYIEPGTNIYRERGSE